MRFEITGLAGSQRVHRYLEAVNAEAVHALARAEGWTVLRVTPAPGGQVFAWLQQRIGGRRVTPFPLMLFSRELLGLISSGLTLVESLHALSEKETDPHISHVINGVCQRLLEGESFSNAIAHFPGAFPTLYVSTMRAAERTSDLPQALRRFMTYQSQLDQARQKVVSASIYPLLLLFVGGLVTVFLLGFVTPRFAAIYQDNLANLPWGSRLLIEWGGLLSAHAGRVALAAAGLLGAAGFVFSRPAVRAWISRAVWRLPRLGEQLRVFQLTRFYRTVSMLLSGGIPAVTALEMSASLLSPEMQVRLARATGAVREGRALSHALEDTGLTTKVSKCMLRVGERGGQMAEMLESAAAFHDDETSRFIDRFTRLFEPLLMVVIGVLIGLIVVLLYLPIFELAGSLE